MPGEVIRATRLWVAADEEAAENILQQANFVTGELVSCHIGAGARLWSDFRIQPDGYGRLLLAANGLLSGDLSRLLHEVIDHHHDATLFVDRDVLKVKKPVDLGFLDRTLRT